MGWKVNLWARFRDGGVVHHRIASVALRSGQVRLHGETKPICSEGL
jgi:hypothetical protein